MHEVKATSSQIICNDNSAVIHKIHGLQEEGIKINLFIGRLPSEFDVPLPEAREGEVWVSLDIMCGDPEFLKINPERLHLVIDCNQSDEMKSINNLFERVVVDISTVKNFENDSFSNFVDLVRKGGSFIFPSDSATFEYGEGNGFYPFRLTVSEGKLSAYNDRLVECLAEFCKQFGDVAELKTRKALIDTYQDQILDSEAYKNWIEQLDPGSIQEGCPKHILAGDFLDSYAAEKGITFPTYREEQAIAHEKTKEALQEQFNHVEFHDLEPYPYREETDRKYFDASDRK